MSDYFAMSEQELNALANAINTKTGESGQICGSQMASKVLSIQSLADILVGGDLYIDFDVPAYAFYMNTRITSVTFGPNCHSIGEAAFYKCTGLTSVDFSNSGITSIGNSAFYQCSNLAGILDLSNPNLLTIGQLVFVDCYKITSLLLGNHLQYIDSQAFNGCTGISGTVVFPASLNWLGSICFNNCSGIDDVVMLKPNGVVTLNGSSSSLYVFRLTKFATEGNNAHIYVPSNLLSIYQATAQYKVSPYVDYLTPYTSSATIGTDTYSYDYGNTFAQWVASAYNTDGFVVSGNNVLNSAKTHYVAENGIAVAPTKQFIGTTYTLEAI